MRQKLAVSRSNGRGSPDLVPILYDCLKSIAQGYFPGMGQKFAAWEAQRAKRQLLNGISKKDTSRARTAFVTWFGSLVVLSRQRYLQNALSLKNTFVRTSDYPVSGDWIPGGSLAGKSTVEFLGFFEQEETPQGTQILWSQPTTMIWLPLWEGDYSLVIDWDLTRSLGSDEFVRLYFDGNPLPLTAVKVEEHRLVLDVNSSQKGWHRLDWSVAPFFAPDDQRLLGLPVTAIRWIATQSADRTVKVASGLPTERPV